MQIEQTRQTIIQNLENQGFTILEKSGSLGGINSSVHQCRSKVGNQCLKFYRLPTLLDSRKRCENDLKLLLFCRNNSINNVPFVHQYSLADHWSLTDWIEGESPLFLNYSMAMQIVSFLEETNTQDISLLSNRFSTASEALLSVHSLLSDIYARLGRLLAKKLVTSLDKEVHYWILSVLIPYARNCHLSLSDNRSNFTCLSQIFSQPILSQSDVGVHNIIKSNNKLYFFDFEYSGIDDIAKWICDWICQPNHQTFSAELKETLIPLILESNLKLDLHWQQRVEILLPAFRLKWALIMLNKFLDSEFDYNSFYCVKQYINK